MTRLANLRDIGGLRAADGRWTRRGVLLRSDAPHHDDLPPVDVTWPPRLVLDLRSPAEMSGRHPLSGPTTDIRSLPLGAAARVDRIGPATPNLASLYEDLVTNRPDPFVAGVRALAETEGPALVHCAAGKDRRGLFVAVTLATVGVTRAAILRTTPRRARTCRA